jgi:hypothetical protein
MTIEEFRFHSQLFGGTRFLGFPVAIAAMVALAVYLLNLISVEVSGIVLAIHALVFLFGLQTGALGVTGRDALENLLGDFTFIIYSSRTLPVTHRQLLAAFFVKDLSYYALILTLPATVGFAVVLPLVDLLPLFISLTGMFALGVVTTLLGLSLTDAGIGSRLLGVVTSGGVALAWMNGIDVVQFTPYAVVRSPSALSLLTGLAPVGLLVGIVYLTFTPRNSQETRSRSNQFNSLAARLPPGRGAIAAKTLVDVQRSNGGLVAVLLSVSLLFGVSLYLLQLVKSATGVSVPVGLTMGSLLSLSSFLVYTWLVQFDSVEEYLFLPLSIPDILSGKALAFTLMSYPVALIHYALAVAVLGAELTDAILGLVILVSMMVYFFGLTVYITGFSPNAFLFDVVRFSAFGVGVMVPLVPLLVVSLAVPELTLVNVSLILLFAGLAVSAGLTLYRWSIQKWTQELV